MNIRELKLKLGENSVVNHYIVSRRLKKHKLKILTSEQVKTAEQSLEEKRRVIAEMEKTQSNYCKGLRRGMSRVITNSPYCKAFEPRDELETQIMFLCLACGFAPEEIACYELWGKSVDECREFVSNRECIDAIFRMNNLGAREVFNNKGKTYLKFREYYKRDGVYISNKKDYDDYLYFVERHPIFVKKPAYEAMGNGVELVDLANCGKTSLDFFDSLLKRGPHQLEELVQQSETMAKLNASSVNTVRCITFNTRHGIKAPYYFIKIGRAGSFVDNGGAGGILVGIDQDTGRLNTDGFDEFDNRYENHPDSGVKFNGYQLPNWKQIQEICLEMSSKTPKVKFIGWDMAHTDDGWVVIEGNGMSQMIGPQTVTKCGIKAEVEALMADMDLY